MHAMASFPVMPFQPFLLHVAACLLLLLWPIYIEGSAEALPAATSPPAAADNSMEGGPGGGGDRERRSIPVKSGVEIQLQEEVCVSVVVYCTTTGACTINRPLITMHD